MRWKSKAAYKNNDTRERYEFAWLPIRCVEGYTCWLEHVKITETYHEGIWFEEETISPSTVQEELPPVGL